MCGAVVLRQTNYKKKGAALEEAKAAVEELVLAGGHAAELLPRSPDILSAQVHLAPCCAHYIGALVSSSWSFHLHPHVLLQCADHCQSASEWPQFMKSGYLPAMCPCAL